MTFVSGDWWGRCWGSIYWGRGELLGERKREGVITGGRERGRGIRMAGEASGKEGGVTPPGWAVRLQFLSRFLYFLIITGALLTPKKKKNPTLDFFYFFICCFLMDAVCKSHRRL